MFGQCFLLTAKSGDFEQVFKGSIVLVGIKLFSIQKGTTSQASICNGLVRRLYQLR
jgi:hypothetical protein